MSFHREVLPAEQQDAVRRLAPALEAMRFFLGGGTAVALHLGHRRSLDLNWFTERRFDDPMGLAAEIRDRGCPLEVHGVDRGALHAALGTVRASFFEHRYRLLAAAVRCRSLGCPVASIEDLAAMKLLAIEQRGSKKDFLDIYAIGVHRVPLADMLGCYREKYGIADVSRLYYSLCYFDDADAEPMPAMVADIRWEDAKEAIRAWVQSIAG